MPTTRALARLAARLHAAWAAATRPPETADAGRRFDVAAAAVDRARRRLALADRRRLTLIRPELDADLRAALDDLARRTAELGAAHRPDDPPVPGLAAWADDLRQLGDEFGGLAVDWRAKTLAVVTGPVTLRDVGLGPFAVTLTWETAARSPGAASFRVTARDPRPAAGKPDTPHPHVQDDRLCPGDAAEALAASLRDGRLADSFLLVRSVLTTYNPRSAFAPLESWNGSTCSECDRVVVQDDRFSCEGCDADLCDECSGSCAVCSATRCGECLDRCPVCEDRCCPGCLTPTASDRAVCPGCRATCPACRAAVPADELDGETGRCPDRLPATGEADETADPSPLTEEDAPCEATTPTPGG